MGVKVLGFAGNRPTSPIFYLIYKSTQIEEKKIIFVYLRNELSSSLSTHSVY